MTHHTPTKEGAVNHRSRNIQYGVTLTISWILPIEIEQLLITGKVSGLLYGVAALNKQLSITYSYPKPKF